MPNLYVGIDQSYTGCAVVSYNPAADSAVEHVFDFSSGKAGTGPQRLGHVHHILREHFQALRAAGTVRQVCFEGYAYGKAYRREELGELGGVMRLALIQVFPPHLLHAVAPATVKKFVTGSGRAEKEKILLSVYMRWKFEASGHDAADAYVLARIAACLDSTHLPELKFQAEVIDSILNPKPPRVRARS
ncbi:crossover junction endodeoxyribonuclease RuvC [Streptomyces sp. NPDC057002]|uniref:crossover junction endodeoxyribonuclease RuvC n=1 Tax=Streptomyces sp. NPDC057002 TaxID=3345992 RepID=UPI00362AD887